MTIALIAAMFIISAISYLAGFALGDNKSMQEHMKMLRDPEIDKYPFTNKN